MKLVIKSFEQSVKHLKNHLFICKVLIPIPYHSKKKSLVEMIPRCHLLSLVVDFAIIIFVDFDSYLNFESIKLELGEKERKNNVQKTFQSPKSDYNLMLHFPRLESRVCQMRGRICTQVYITLATLLKRNVSIERKNL